MIERAPVPPERATLELHVVPAEAPVRRLDQQVMAGFDRFPTRASARKACDRGEVAVNGVVSESSRWVGPGDTIGWLEPLDRRVRPLPRSMPVLYEDDQLAVIDKPAGLVTMRTWGRTVERALPFNLTPSTAPDALADPRPVHRLDASTSGVLVVAKTRSAHAALGRLFEERRVDKRYGALVVGELVGAGVVELPIDGRDAVTEYRSVSVTPALRGGAISTVELWPRTGRTHQLRRHLAHLGAPILGDTLYGRPGQTLIGKGLFLYAASVRFDHPATGVPLEVAAPEPPKFASFREREARRHARWHAVGGGAPPVM
ncbi:MAG: RluA family pseudouridine synthase [Myxococcota bacterium]